jgi:hypothetical protein
VSYLFVFRAYPDVDHMAPLAWKLLEDGEEVHAVISPGYDPALDPRLGFLRRYPAFHEHRVSAAARNTVPYAAWLLLRHRVRLVAVEWGYGLREGHGRRRLSAAGLVAALRGLGRSFLRARDPFQTRSSFLVAARLLDRPAVCLPHGLSIKLDAASATSEVGRTLDWRDRNRFAAYVLNTAHHRRWFIEHAGGDPEVMQTWGSLRWAPEWVDVNKRLAPAFEWPEPAEGRLKVVFMVPKWRNRVHADRVEEFVARLHALDFVSFAVKGHPRASQGGADPLRSSPRIDWSHIHDVSGVESVPLIGAADVVIDIGSSIGIEVVMQGKVLMNPSYLHELTTFFDTVPGSCVVVHDPDEAVAYLREHAEGRPHRVPDEARQELLRRAIYGSEPEPFDVLERYSRNVRALASAANGGGPQLATASRR